jgi:hypothetical protein
MIVERKFGEIMGDWASDERVSQVRYKIGSSTAAILTTATNRND